MEKTLNNNRLLDVIAILSSEGETGRLQIRVGTTGGAFFFKKGKLVDARMGTLSGFAAVNATVSIREARFSFDSSIQPPPSNFNNPGERIVLKQLFGIETMDPAARNAQVSLTGVEPAFTRPKEVLLSEPKLSASDRQNDAHKQAQEEGSTESERELEKLEEAEDLAKRKETVEAQRTADERSKLRRTIAYPLLQSWPSSSHSGLYLAILLVLMGAGAVAFVQKWSERRLPTLTGKPSESSLPLPTQISRQFEQKSSGERNLTGQWKVINTVEKTSYRSFTNLELGFRLRINQTGTHFTAEGEKVSENGRILPATGQTPICLTGSIDGDRVEATFVEQGVRRKTGGRFVWRIENAGAGLTGRFVSTAARSTGTSAATKEL